MCMRADFVGPGEWWGSLGKVGKTRTAKIVEDWSSTSFGDVQIGRTALDESPVCAMSKKIENPAECETRSIICFLNARNMKSTGIHRHLYEMHGQHAIVIQ
jgi:hypothetical protein